MPRPRATRARDGRRGVHSSCTYLAGRVRGAMADALAAQKGQAPNGTCPDLQMAEGEGFEPSYPRRGKRFSRPPHSTALPPLRGVKSGAPVGRRWIYWRRVWDLNPGYALGVYTISNRAPSATRTTLQEPRRLVYRKSSGSGKLFFSPPVLLAGPPRPRPLVASAYRWRGTTRGLMEGAVLGPRIERPAPRATPASSQGQTGSALPEPPQGPHGEGG